MTDRFIQTSVLLDVPTREKLDWLADHLGQTKSGLMRTAIIRLWIEMDALKQKHEAA
jgi:predicted DNA-binding protein